MTTTTKPSRPAGNRPAGNPAGGASNALLDRLQSAYERGFMAGVKMRPQLEEEIAHEHGQNARGAVLRHMPKRA